jgi:hypothetical protein
MRPGRRWRLGSRWHLPSAFRCAFGSSALPRRHTAAHGVQQQPHAQPERVRAVVSALVAQNVRAGGTVPRRNVRGRLVSRGCTIVFFCLCSRVYRVGDVTPPRKLWRAALHFTDAVFLPDALVKYVCTAPVDVPHDALRQVQAWGFTGCSRGEPADQSVATALIRALGDINTPQSVLSLGDA